MYAGLFIWMYSQFICFIFYNFINYIYNCNFIYDILIYVLNHQGLV